MMFSSQAQDKVLTMEEAILGYHLYPKSLYLQWQGDRDLLTYVEGGNLIGESPAKGEKKVLMTVDDLNRIQNAGLGGWPQFSWKDGKTLLITRQGKMA